MMNIFVVNNGKLIYQIEKSQFIKYFTIKILMMFFIHEYFLKKNHK